MKTFNSATLALAFLCIADSAMGSDRPKRDASPDAVMTAKEELTFTGADADGYAKFKETILPELPFAVMKKEIVLAKFFRSYYMDLDSALKGARDALKWRKDNHMEFIHKEDHKKTRGKFEVSMDLNDLQGRPIMYMQTGKYKLKEALTKGEGLSYERTFYQLFDESAYKAVMAYEAGNAYAQFIMVLNYDHWTTEQGACGDCVALVTRLAVNFDSLWPNCAYKIMLINVDEEFHLFLDIIRLALSKETNAKVKSYGRKKEDWWGEATALIGESQLKKITREK